MKVSERSSCVRGYHIYKDVWDAVIGKEIQCEREPDTNKSDCCMQSPLRDGDNHWSSAT